MDEHKFLSTASASPDSWSHLTDRERYILGIHGKGILVADECGYELNWAGSFPRSQSHSDSKNFRGQKRPRKRSDSVKVLLNLYTAIILFAISFLTLYIFDFNYAKKLCWFYAMGIVITAVVGIFLEMKMSKSKKENEGAYGRF